MEHYACALDSVGPVFLCSERHKSDPITRVLSNVILAAVYTSVEKADVVA